MAEINSPVNIKEKVGSSNSTVQTEIIFAYIFNFYSFQHCSHTEPYYVLTLCMKLSTQILVGLIWILLDEKHFYFRAERLFCQLEFSYSFVITVHTDAVESSTLGWLLLYKMQPLKKHAL